MNATTQRPLFDISVAPTFLVVNGKIQYSQGGFRGTLSQGERIEYKKHGIFLAEYIGDSYALIHHTYPWCKTHKIFIPQKKRAWISGGKWHFDDVCYKSFEEESNPTFKVGDKVRFKSHKALVNQGTSHEATYTVGAVYDLPNPNHHYVDPYYWNDPKWEWAREKTRLQVIGHHQVVFLEEVENTSRTGIPPMYPDPETWRGKNRVSFSGSWFHKVV